MIVAILARRKGRVLPVWDDDLWGEPPADQPTSKPVEPDSEEGWPEVRRPGPQSTRAKVTVLAVAIAVLVATVILCCTALNRLAELYFLDLNPIHLL
jgi:hypothetical protein